MESRAKIAGHAAHQLLIVFPLGLLSTAPIFDLFSLATGSSELSRVAYWMIVAGVGGGLCAAPFGTIDWLAIPRGTRAKRIGLLHGGSAVGLLALFAFSGYHRHTVGTDWIALGAGFSGILAALFVGWTGGELVDRLGMAVHDGAHLNSPNSLSGRSAHENRSASAFERTIV